MEGKLACSTHVLKLGLTSFGLRAVFLLALLSALVSERQTAYAQVDMESPPFTIVLFMCVWKRPLLTDFVLSQYQKLKKPLLQDGVELDIFIAGSDNATTPVLAKKYGASFAVHPNSPLGAKHDMGIQSLRSFYNDAVEKGARLQLPHAVAIVGSDDVINAAFFLRVRDLMQGQFPRQHVVGLRDIHFFDLKSRRLVYTSGYRSFKTPISGTLGCGRVLSWSILEALDWHVWDLERERGLDQSAIRNVLRRVPLVGEVSGAIAGRDSGIVAVDIKSDGFAAGANIWKFEQVVEAVGKNGRLHSFVDCDARETLGDAFGSEFLSRLEKLRVEMTRLESN